MTINRVVLSAIYYGQTCQNSMHFENTDGFLTLQQVAEEIRDNFLPDFKFLSNDLCVWNNIHVRDISNLGANAFNLTVNLPGGQSGNNQNFPFVALVVRLRTDFGGRAGRGRWYIPGLNIGLTDKGVWTAALLNLAGPKMAEIFDRYKLDGPGPLTLGVCKQNTPGSFHSVTSLQVAPVPGVQRRRNIGVGI